MTLNGADFVSPILLSLKISVVASIIVLIIGAMVAWAMTRRRRFRGYTLVETFIMLPLVLPPTVVGFLLLVILGKKSGIGQLVERLFAQPIIFTWMAAVIASVVVAFPLVYQSVKTGLLSVDRDLLDAARSMGASEWQLLVYITIPLAKRSLVTAYVLGFARGLGEFGATLMIAGNIPNRTQTLPTAIYLAVESGNQALAWAWTGAIILISFTLLGLTAIRPKREEEN